ncbi:hypothetical protein OROGR_011335 [Orobanche gracilis]
MNTNSSSDLASFESPSTGGGSEIQNTSKPLWRYVTQCEIAGNGGGGVTWECNFCHLKKTSTFPKVRSHLLREKNKEITPCEVTPKNLADMRTLLELEKENETATALKKVPLPPFAMFSGELYTGHDSKRRKESGGSSSSLQKAFNLQGRNQLHALIES